MDLTIEQRRALAARFADAAAAAIAGNPDRTVALRVRGTPLTSATLSDSERQALLNHMRLASLDEADAEYDRAMDLFLHRLVRETNSQGRGSLGVFGLPIEPESRSLQAARAVNDRFAGTLDAVTALVSARAVVAIDSGVNELSLAREAMPEAFARADGRRVLYRFNGLWRQSDGVEAQAPEPMDSSAIESGGNENVQSGTNGPGGSLTFTEFARGGGGRDEGGGDQGGGGDSHEFVPKGTRGIMVGCAGATAVPGNPLGLRQHQYRSLDDAREFYRYHYARAERLGVNRIIWHMPAGWQESGMRGRFAVLSVMGPRGQVFVDEARRFLDAHPDASLGVYISCHMPQTIHSWRDDDILPVETYDHDNARHRAMVDEVMAPLAEAGFKEVWFDNSAPEEFREHILRLAEYLRTEYHMYTVMEGVPSLRQRGTTQRLLDTETLSQVAAMGIHRLLLLRDPETDWVIPDETEVMAVLTSHDVERNGGETMPTDEEVQSYIDRGFTLFSFGEEFDDYLSWPEGGVE